MRLLNRPVDKLGKLGADMRFYLSVLGHIPSTLRHYPKEVIAAALRGEPSAPGRWP